MPHQEASKKVYYHVMEGSRCIFADERNKRKLLDLVRGAKFAEHWRIYAFCIMDECAYFIIEADDARGVCRGMHRIEKQFLHLFQAEPWSRRTIAAPVLSDNAQTELHTLPEIAACCRRIHRIPLQEGFVSRLCDYWWSSYITYCGSYNWELVDCCMLLLYFSVDPDTARRRLLHYHREESL